MPVTVTMPDGEIAMMARQLAARLGVSEIEAVRTALRRTLEDHWEVEQARSEINSLRARLQALEGDERLLYLLSQPDVVARPKAARRETARAAAVRRRRAMDRISLLTAALPVLDFRSEEEILGYDEMTS